jgi:hypothetical protein
VIEFDSSQITGSDLPTKVDDMKSKSMACSLVGVYSMFSPESTHAKSVSVIELCWFVCDDLESRTWHLAPIPPY